MPRGKRYAYIVDGLTAEKGQVIEKGLKAIPDIFAVGVSPSRGLIEVQARKDVEDQIRIACDIAKARFRTKMR